MDGSTLHGCIAVLNAGSSSVKFALYEAGDNVAPLFRGQVEQLGLAPRMKVVDGKGETVTRRKWTNDQLDHRRATEEILKLGRELLTGRQVIGIGHRVVHGGTRFDAPARIDADVLAYLATLVPLAPLHQPHNLAPIEAIAEAARICRRSPASTPPSIAARPRWPSTSRYRRRQSAR